MNTPQRFTAVIQLPDMAKGVSIVTGIIIGLSFPVSAGLIVALFAVLPDRYGILNWDRRGYTIAVVTLSLLVCLLIMSLRRWQRRRLTRIIAEWNAAFPRRRAERSAADFYLGLIGVRKPGRAAAVTAYLASVTPDESRTIVLGEHAVKPEDDGSLSEETDAFEGRFKSMSRWFLFFMTLPFTVQFIGIIMLHGVNPIYWSGKAFLLATPFLFNIFIIAMAFGAIRPPGSVVLAAPRRVQHSSLRGSWTFTPEDSVLLVAAANRTVVLMLYRNDGAWASINYPRLETPGLKLLINRWCMAPTIQPGTDSPPAPMPQAAI